MNTNTKITFGTYEGWGLDEMFDEHVFKAIKEIEECPEFWREDVLDTYQELLSMVPKARKDFLSKYYATRRNFHNKGRLIRLGSARKKVFSETMMEMKNYIETRFPKAAKVA